MMKNKLLKAVIPGSYDPITNGHFELICRAAELFDEVTVLICINSEKKSLLNREAKQVLIKKAIEFSGKNNIKCDICDGLFAEYCNRNNIDVVVKGIRNSSDYSYESDLKVYNDKIFSEKYGKIPETVFLQSVNEWAFCSSTFVREMIKYNENIEKYVPDAGLLIKLLNDREEINKK